MKTQKYLILLLVLLLSLISISAITAADNSTDNSISTANTNELILEENINEDFSSSNENSNIALNENNNKDNLDSEIDNPTLTDSTPLNFNKLNEAINGNTNDTIYLTNNYTYNSGTDSAYIDGIHIGRNLTIYGNGITIDGNHMARIFKARLAILQSTILIL